MTHIRIHETMRVRLFGLVLMLGSLLALPVHAQGLDGEAVRQLALQGTWEAEHAEFGLWTWNSDNTVCLRVGARDGDCADTGTWTITKNVLCYELTWWGESAGERKNCFTVQPIDEGRYETIFHGAPMVSRMFVFKVLN